MDELQPNKNDELGDITNNLITQRIDFYDKNLTNFIIIIIINLSLSYFKVHIRKKMNYLLYVIVNGIHVLNKLEYKTQMLY